LNGRVALSRNKGRTSHAISINAGCEMKHILFSKSWTSFYGFMYTTAQVIPQFDSTLVVPIFDVLPNGRAK
jgi:hypothetical protein